MESRGPIRQHKYGKVTVGALMKAMLVGTTHDNVRAALAEGAESTGCVSVPASRHRAGSSGIILDGDWASHDRDDRSTVWLTGSSRTVGGGECVRYSAISTSNGSTCSPPLAASNCQTLYEAESQAVALPIQAVTLLQPLAN
jgi:hypothetical protein